MYERQFLTALAATITIESGVILGLARITRDDTPSDRLAACAAAASALTLPYVWYVLPSFVPEQTQLFWVEAFAVVIEAIFYRLFLSATWTQAIIYSAVANAASLSFGLAVRSFGLQIF